MPTLALSETFTINYEEYGDPSAPIVVLLHGFTATLRMWSQQVEALAVEYRVIVPDMRGHGLTTSPEEPDDYGIARYAQDLRDLMAGLEIEICALVGCSFGGMVALQFATTYPELVACLVVSDSSPAYEHPAYDARFRNREAGIREQEEYARGRGMAALGKKLAADVSDSFLADAIRNRFGRMNADGYLGAARTRRERPDLTPILRERLTMPVLLCDGEDDPVFCALDVMARELPHARVVAFRDAGHGLPAQRPGPFTQMLMEFLHDVEDGKSVAGRRRV